MDPVVEHFEVKVVKIQIVPHDHADSLEIAKIEEYNSIVKKGMFKDGELAVYLPEQSVIPEDLVGKLVDEGILPANSKSAPFVVKPIKLRGILSQGVVMKAQPEWTEGKDVKEILGIKKWEPPIESIPFFKGNMSMNTYNAGNTRCIKYDIEHYKKYHYVLEEEEIVTFTEKLHGTWSQFAYMSKNLENPKYGPFVVTSKGLGAKGVAFIINEENTKNNVYLQTAEKFGIKEKIAKCMSNYLEDNQSVFLLGEIFGAGVQDLSYGEKKGSILYRVFDIYIGTPGQGKYLSDEELEKCCKNLGLDRVPVLYRGPYNKKVLEEYTNGKETISGKSLHTREGVVIRPVVERYHPKIGRVQLKSISEAYLLRKNGTEFN